MTDSTRVNDVQEKLLQAMSIVNGKLLETISYDTTITATITDNTDKADGKYILSNGSKTFTAYSSITNYSNNTTVYVTIPNGNWENQKMIIGKKTSDAETPFVFTTPFDTIFDMTGNKVGGAKNVSILANAGDEYNSENDRNVIFEYDGSDILISSDYTRLALSTDFCTWLKNAVNGRYGILIELTYLSNDVTGEVDKEVPVQWVFENSQFYGNTYNFESFYNQQIVFDISDYGAITKLKLTLVEFSDFIDEEGNYLPIVDEISDIPLFDNIFVKDVYLCAGHDIGIFQDDYVEIYTEDKLTYDKSQYGTDDNKRIVNLRWVHIEDGTPVKIEESDFDAERDEIRWYRYHIGEKAADDYCGVYWEYADKEYTDLLEQLEKDIEEANQDEQVIEKLKKAFEEATKNITPSISQGSFSITFIPNTEWQQEKLKVIVFRDKVPYRSNELVFENQEEVPSYSTIEYQNALVIQADDESNGNYMVYRQDNDLIDEIDSNIERNLSVWFDTNLDGTAESKVNPTADSVTWIIPTKNSMLQFVGYSNSSNLLTTVSGACPSYTIRRYYSPSYSNNTVICNYTLNGRTYTTEKEFTFGYSGTMGTDQTIVIDFAGDTKAYTIDDQVAEFIVRLYDSANKEIAIPNDTNIKWFWKDTTDNSDDETVIGTTQTLTLNALDWKHQNLKILGVSVGDLTTYFAIPIRTKDYSFIGGATQVIYQTNGEPSYCTDAYTLFDTNGNLVGGVTWTVVGGDDYKATINTSNKLSPIGMYIDGAATYGVTAAVNSNVVWTQPILVMQNRWSSNVVNKWSGKEISIDNENGTIVAPAIAAGKKENDNTFSGVMLGSWADTDTNPTIAGKTGIYGFNCGKMSYAFMDDGKAFIGKSGYGRINFNGNYATLYSSGYENGSKGMKIDLNSPYIDMRYDSNSYIKMDFNNNHPRLRVQSGSSSYFLLDSVSGSSKISLTGSKGSKSGTITLSSLSSEDPLTIGSLFYVEWDGTIHATDGVFKGEIDADAGYLGNLSIDGDLNIAKGGSITAVAGRYDEDGPIYIKYESNRIGSFGIVTGKDGDSGSKTYNIGIIGTDNYSNGYKPSIVLESQRNIRLSAADQLFLVGAKLNCSVPASQQTGIYARFA